MDPRLLDYYNRELRHLREMGGEFAAEFPKIASRLTLDGLECADPYVERLLEGFAFLTARVQLKFDAGFPRFTEHLLEAIYPHYLSPLPSMAVVQFQPDLTEPNLARGQTIPRGSALHSRRAPEHETACEYRTAHDLPLWPLVLQDADYLPCAGDLAALGITGIGEAKAGLRLTFNITAGLRGENLDLDRLPLFLPGAKQTPIRLYEQLLAGGIGFVVRPAGHAAPWQAFVDAENIRPLGFGGDEALLPCTQRSFSGHRLLQEYFAFPSRFLFVELGGLRAPLRRCTASAFEIIVLLKHSDPELDRAVDASAFALFCTPAINLFPRRADRIRLTERDSDYHVVPDRTRPMDFEVHSVTNVVGHGAGQSQKFQAFYAHDDHARLSDAGAFYAVHRTPRLLSSKQHRAGPRSSYVGSEVRVSIVDTHEAPYHGDLRELAVETLCTNRDLPLHLPLGGGGSDFRLDSGAAVLGVRCLAGPTAPRAAFAEGEAHWRLINHLSLNYLSLLDGAGQTGAAALRDLLGLYADASEASLRKQIEGVRSIAHRPINRRLPSPGPISFGRGLEITVTCNERSFEGTGAFLLGSVLEQFFARYVSINSFTETVLHSVDRGEIMRWPTRLGRRPVF
ncbi:MAG: type VI secretion system baseplate subunit TssF [Rhodocyclaceae bacterium]